MKRVPKISIKCTVCQHEFQALACKKQKMCSEKCARIAWVNRFAGKNRKERTPQICGSCGRTYFKNYECDKRAFCSLRCRSEGMSRKYMGENSPSWRGGLTPEKRRIRNSISYRNTQHLVFLIDDYTCQQCGKRGGDLEMHHIAPFWREPERVLDIGNLISLCGYCHNKTKGREEDFELVLESVRAEQLLKNFYCSGVTTGYEDYCI